MVYDDGIEDKIDAISEQFRVKYPDMENMRWHAIKTLEQDDSVTKKYPVGYDRDCGPETMRKILSMKNMTL